MHKNTTKCNKTQSKWCINKPGASKIIDTFETYQVPLYRKVHIGLITKVFSDSKRRIDHTDHILWNGTDKPAEIFLIMYIFRRLGWAMFPRGTTIGMAYYSRLLASSVQRVDYGVKEASDWQVFNTAPQTMEV
jgi:hypothetical protein